MMYENQAMVDPNLVEKDPWNDWLKNYTIKGTYQERDFPSQMMRSSDDRPTGEMISFDTGEDNVVVLRKLYGGGLEILIFDGDREAGTVLYFDEVNKLLQFLES